MSGKFMRGLLWNFVLAAVSLPLLSQAPPARGAVELRVDNLRTPLGIDDPAPRFSWQLRDPAQGALQTAYQVDVASSAAGLKAKADIWSSGRIDGAQSMNVAYHGPTLSTGKRYYWRVKVWDAAGKEYPPSEMTWWETGLLIQDAWNAPWIGFETAEEAAVRQANAQWIANPEFKQLATEKAAEQHFAYRGMAAIDKAVRSATLYATCQDTVSAWVNGVQVLLADPLPPYKQMPWKKYVSAAVGKQLAKGANTVALDCVHYVVNPNGMATDDAPPLNATLYVEYGDGTNATFASGPGWKTAIHPAGDWRATNFDDAQWKNAVEYETKAGVGDAPLGHPWIPDSVKALRQTFTVGKGIKSARLYSTALGTYEMFLNGKRVSEDVLAPGWTDYRERVVYQTYDVTAMLVPGKNAIGALLAPGWYSTPLEWFQQPNNYGDTPPALRAQLMIEHTDGSIEWIKTGADWQAAPSHIVSTELYDGETQDARMMQPGWATAAFVGGKWNGAAVFEPKPIRIQAQDFQPIRVERTVTAKSVSEPKRGVYVFDFGQNLAGVEHVRLHGPEGTIVKLRFAEILNDDGTLYTDNLRTAKVTDHFILAGRGIEDFTPQFTFHGFRYAEITGLPARPGKDAMTVAVIHTDAPFDAKLKTGSTMIDKLWSNIVWGQRSNFVGVPTDCPQRDERLGWMADAQVFWRTATYNMDLAPFSRKYSADMRGTQAGTPIYGIYAPGTVQSASGSGAGWSDAGVIIPWTSWLQTGDTSIIEQNWEGMQKYLAAIEEANPDGLWKKLSGTPFGDWLSPEGKTDQVLVATAYWAYDVTLMQQMAHAISDSPDEQHYKELFGKIRDAFQKTFVHEDGFIAGADNTPSPFGQINNPNAKSKGGDTQTGYVLALHMNLLPEKLRAAAVQKLVKKIDDNHGLLATGFLGTPYLLEELTKAGQAALAYKLLLNTQYPSWGYLVEHGATTMWERWNGDQMKDDPSMNSYNHYAYGAVADWMYRYAAGIDATPLDAGFHTVVLHPVFDARLGSIAFDYESSYGAIHSDWTMQGKAATWHVNIPANTTGWLGPDAAKYKLDGVALNENRQLKAATRDGQEGFEVPAGSYTFDVEPQ
ncbi:MAG TPA: family 78 glycoside hydrolase catalytic domain [Terracidiphilus sp.]|jgi:alpha-L-rhamnosidase